MMLACKPVHMNTFYSAATMFVGISSISFETHSSHYTCTSTNCNVFDLILENYGICDCDT